MADRARLAAYEAVKRIDGGAYSNLVAAPKELEGVDRAFADRIILGTTERRITLEYLLSPMIRQSTDNGLKALVMTGAYQILYLDRVPDSAAVNETVTIASEIFGHGAARFVNAVLRETAREKGKMLAEAEKAGGHVAASADRELYGLLKEQYPDKIDGIFASFFGAKPTYLRVNTLKTDAKTVAVLTDGVVLSETTVVTSNAAKAVEAAAKGGFFIQGPGSQRAVAALRAEPGDTVVDVCACPGGKSLGAAIDMKNEGKICSFDIHENKLKLIEKSARRLGIDIIETAACDAKKGEESLFGKADRVVCDVPCSGTGVMGAKPEIKYKSPAGFARLYEVQRAIISTSAKYLKTGGRMVYSTCSINRFENEEVVKSFLEENGGFRLEAEKLTLPDEKTGEGFYTASLIREK